MRESIGMHALQRDSNSSLRSSPSVEKRIHLLRSDVMFYDQVNSVNNMSMSTDPKRTWRSLQIDKFHKYVEDSSLSFSPYGITIDGRLALYLFYIIATLVFTVYVEILF